MFTYIAASPFIFQEHFGMSPLAYSLCFGANAVGIMLGSLAVSLFYDASGALRIGTIGFGIMSLFVAAVFIFTTSVWLAEATGKEEFGKRLGPAWLYDVSLRGNTLSLDRIGKYALYDSIFIVACCIGTGLCNHLAVSHATSQTTKE